MRIDGVNELSVGSLHCKFQSWPPMYGSLLLPLLLLLLYPLTNLTMHSLYSYIKSLHTRLHLTMLSLSTTNWFQLTFSYSPSFFISVVKFKKCYSLFRFPFSVLLHPLDDWSNLRNIRLIWYGLSSITCQNLRVWKCSHVLQVVSRSWTLWLHETIIQALTDFLKLKFILEVLTHYLLWDCICMTHFRYC